MHKSDAVFLSMMSKAGYEVFFGITGRYSIYSKKWKFEDRVYIDAKYNKKYPNHAQLYVLNLTKSPHHHDIYEKYNEMIFAFNGDAVGTLVTVDDFLASHNEKVVPFPKPYSHELDEPENKVVKEVVMEVAPKKPEETYSGTLESLFD